MTDGGTNTRPIEKKMSAKPSVLGYLSKSLKSPVYIPKYSAPRNENIKSFISRIKSQGPIMNFKRNVLHISPSRFTKLCDDLKGLCLDQAFLQIKWNRRNIDSIMNDALTECLVKAKESGFNLDKTYIADVYANSKDSLFCKTMKKYIKGRGRYGSTPTPIFTTLEIMLQQRKTPFKAFENDPLHSLKNIYREKQRPWVKSVEEIYKDQRSKRPIKQIYF